jgi:cyclopropane fatty-acyl-phospholipid synthase-like methyltransferase
MSSPLANILDKRRLAMTRARFKAWWDGAEFDEDAAVAALDAEGAPEAANDSGAEDALFDSQAPDLPARLTALSTLWGEGRVMPGDAESEAAMAAQLGLSAEKTLLVVGPGLSAPVLALAGAHAGPMHVCEWREETASVLTALIKHAGLAERVTSARIDLETHAFETADAIISFDEFTFADEPTRFAHHITKALKPDARIMVETYAGLPSPDIAPAFASSFAEPHVRAAGDIAHFLIEAGLKIEAQDDLTESHIELAKAGFKNLESALKNAGNLDVSVARELAWEAEAWRMRLKLLGSQRLERRRIVARRPAS